MSRSPIVPLGSIVKRVKDEINISDNETYARLTIRLNGKGIVKRDEITGLNIGTKKQFIARAGQLVLSKIDARNGAFGVLPDDCDNAIITGNFWAFDVDQSRLIPKYFDYLTKTRTFVEFCLVASEGTTNRRYLQEERFLSQEIPLPPLSEQRRVVARIEELSAQIYEARTLRDEIENDLHRMLSGFHQRISVNARRRPLIEVAPLCRRPVTVDVDTTYPTISARSFGRGTFHPTPLIGSEVTWEKPFSVMAGDILISNIKAWEGALAVVEPSDDGRVCSHRYLTCTPIAGVATSRFLCFYLLSPEGLYEIGEASPGSADRNRTLGAKALMQIPVPVPEYEEQLRFDALSAEVDALKRLQAETSAELDALLPAILDRAFKGEL